jgi:hypothetical protein
VSQGQHGCNRHPRSPSHPYLNAFTEASKNVLEPCARLWNELMPTPRFQNKFIEFVKEFLVITLLVAETRFFGAPDSSLDRVLVKALENLRQGWCQI